MRKIREALRLHYDAGLGVRAVSRSLKASPSTVREYLVRAKLQGLTWPLPESLDDAGLLQRLYPTPASSSRALPVPDWSKVHRELRRKGVTLALLWEEYKTVHPEGMQYSWFCARYRAWAAKVDVVMRQEHRAGEKMFVDYAGHTVGVANRDTGELREAQIFVAVLGASNYTYAEATWTQTLPDWIASHVRAFEFMGGSTELVIPDNLRSAVSRAHRYEPDTNPTYHDLACHYAVAVLPARVKKPRDKAKAEVAVQVVERWILAALRNRTFFSLAELNAAIAKLLERLNNRPFRKLPGSRRSLFEQLDRPALRPLPAERYVFAQWKKARVNISLSSSQCSSPLWAPAARPARKVQPLGAEMLHRGGGRASAREGVEHQPQTVLYLSIGVEHHTTERVVDQAHRQRHLQRPASGLIQYPTAQPSPQQVQLRLRHGPLKIRARAGR